MSGLSEQSAGFAGAMHDVLPMVFSSSEWTDNTAYEAGDEGVRSNIASARLRY
jgi:hypothetical protein